MSTPLTGGEILTLVRVFNGLNILGVVLLVLTIIPAIWSHTVHRMDAWYSLTASSMLYCASFLILIGRQFGEEPPFGLCLFQAALIYACPIFITISITTFTISLYLNVSNIPTTSFRRSMLIAAPLVMFLVICIEVTIVGLSDRSVVERDPTHMYCHCHNTSIPIGVDLFIEVLTAGVDIAFLVMIGRTLYRRWKTSQTTLNHQGGGDSTFSNTLYVRVLLFTIYLTLALSIVAVAVPNPSNSSAAWNLSLPTAPIMTALIFGSQRDILRAWAGYLRGLGSSVRNLPSKVFKKRWRRVDSNYEMKDDLQLPLTSPRIPNKHT